MPLLDIFKKKKEQKPKAPKAIETKVGKSHGTLRSPQITEKATELAKRNQYTFKVAPRANKTEVKKDVEGLYKVDVLHVNMVKVPRRKRRLGKIWGWRKGYKKAIVKVKEGQKIEMMPR